MATVEETYKLALENRNALNLIKDKAKATDEFPLVAAQDTDLVRVTRAGVSSHTPVSDIRSLSGAGEDNVQSDWSVADDQLDTYIREKPTKLSEFENDLEAIEVTADAYSNLDTGLITGGVVTINAGDNTKFDVSAGTGIILNWTVPTAPVRHEVSWAAVVGMSVPNILADFTALSINSVGTIIAVSGVFPSPNSKRIQIQLQGLGQAQGIIISVGASSRPSYQGIDGVLDYIAKLGALNEGNKLTANGVNLNINKSSGTTTFPFINRVNDLQNPTQKTNVAQEPITFIQTGDAISITNLITPGTWNNAGFEDSVGANNWTVQRGYFFGSTDQLVMSYGKATYGNLGDAESGYIDEVFDEEIYSSAVLVTVIAIKGNASDLSNAAQAKFINIASFQSGGSSGGGGAGIGDMEKSVYDTDNNGVVDNSELFDGKPTTDFVLEVDHHLTHEGELQVHKYPGNLLKTLEVNDIVKGWWSTALYLREAQYDGGDDTLIASYTIIDSIEY